MVIDIFRKVGGTRERKIASGRRMMLEWNAYRITRKMSHPLGIFFPRRCFLPKLGEYTRRWQLWGYLSVYASLGVRVLPVVESIGSENSKILHGLLRLMTQPAGRAKRFSRTRGSSRFGSGGVRSLTARVGSDQEFFKYHELGWVTLGDPGRSARGNPTRENPW